MYCVSGVQRCVGKAGIGGVLRDYSSKTLMYFPKSAGVVDVLSAEILALVEAMKLFGESKWVDKFKVVFECDSKLIIDWILRPHIAPVKFKRTISSFFSISNGVEWSLQFAPRECNTMADILAKKGIDRASDLTIFDPP
ncbi:hypothetical protein GQ457_06G023470 [Hibiscus cannabinus]